jgi:hypothetical protein|uniref:Uncharacterized protein n=1 Tax=viral metagenome TaxID=1070528 RepID=A0A6C0HET5_9ZZZZ
MNSLDSVYKIDSVRLNLINKSIMQRFPVTKQELQNFDRNKVKEFYKNQQKQIMFKTIINEIYNNIENELLINKTIKYYIWKDLKKLNLETLYIHKIPYFTHTGQDHVLPEFIDELKKMFIDCEITIDRPSQSIKISWE